jgi:hypothetical protein
LYALNPVARRRPVRVTVTARPGVARAARIAMALQLPVRVLSVQPAADVIGELGEVLDEYLHGPRTSAPVEVFQSALARWLHGDAPPAWVALELDPDWYPRVADEGETRDSWPVLEPGFVQAHLERLERDGAECGACRFRDWCQGFFKWPDPAYHCAPGVMPLLARVEESARQLARDLDQFQPDSR